MRSRWLCVIPGGCSDGRAGAAGGAEGVGVVAGFVFALPAAGAGAGVAGFPVGGLTAALPGVTGLPGVRLPAVGGLADAPVAAVAGA